MMVTEMRVDHFLTLHFILRVFAIKSNLGSLSIQLLLNHIKKVLGAIGMLPRTQVNTGPSATIINNSFRTQEFLLILSCD